jgi:uncharacterized membrane protein YeiB
MGGKKMTLKMDKVLAPVKTKVRGQSLDVIRGVAILGILPVDSDGICYSPRSLH